jgi:hypothetical protein
LGRSGHIDPNLRRYASDLFSGHEKPGSTTEEYDELVAAYKRDIDRTLLRENLRKSVEDRVRGLMALQELADEARRAGNRLKKTE